MKRMVSTCWIGIKHIKFKYHTLLMQNLRKTNTNYIYKHKEFKEISLLKKSYILNRISKIPQFEQKSEGWFNQRNNCLTATAIAAVLDEDPYKSPAEILLDKCFRGKPFVDNANVHHGTKYEKIGNMYYAEKNNINVLDFGLLQHELYSFIGASPDGICDNTCLDKSTLSTLVGRLLEIKFPKMRKIITEGKLDGEICPHYYFVQVQTQLFVTGLDECDFLQCQMAEYLDYDEFIEDTDPDNPGFSKTTKLENGCIIQLLPLKMITDPISNNCIYNAKYLYPPKMHMSIKEIDEWILFEFKNFPENAMSKKYMIDKIIYWKFTKISCDLIKADTPWMSSKIPLLKQFWNYILFYRKHDDKLDLLEEYIKETGIKKSKIIFERVNKDYLESNPNCNYKPLYQVSSEWRIKYNRKYKNKS